MLPKKQRISRADFLKKPLHARSFAFGSVKILPGGVSAAVVVSKKVHPRAVERGKVRRRVYSALAALARAGTLTQSVIVYPNKKTLVAPFLELKTALENVVQ
jgi:RNase P protein component